MRYTHLSMDERRVIETLRAAGCSLRVIGLRLAGRNASSISRELRRNGGPDSYTAMVAHRRATHRLKGRWRPRRFADTRLAAEVRSRLGRRTGHRSRSSDAGPAPCHGCPCRRSMPGCGGNGRGGCGICAKAWRGGGAVIVNPVNTRGFAA